MNPFERMVTADPGMKEMLRLAARAAASDSTILIEGESGVGKDLLATALHYASARAAGPFVRIDCPNLSEDLLECELFGYEPGAFTDARGRKLGKFELADGGSLYVDGVEHLSAVLQSKLLRPLQERVIERLGAATPRKIDVRLIASTQVDLVDAVHSGAFRGDLLFRLQVIHLRIPPLRERTVDFPLLVAQLGTELAARGRPEAPLIPAEMMGLLTRYPWPGNVRELRNFLERLAVVAVAREATYDEVLRCLPALTSGTRSAPSTTLRQMESAWLQEALKRSHGNKSRAAAMLGISRKSFYDRLKRMGTKDQ